MGKHHQNLNYDFNFMLQKFKLKKTELRLRILEVFRHTEGVLTQAKLIEKLEKDHPYIDRVSIYRNLNQFKEAGIVHELENNFYVSCSHDCGKHPHVLLFCQSCKNHREVKDHLKIASLYKTLKELNFFGSSLPLMMKGTCEDCSPEISY